MPRSDCKFVFFFLFFLSLFCKKERERKERSKEKKEREKTLINLLMRFFAVAFYLLVYLQSERGQNSLPTCTFFLDDHVFFYDKRILLGTF